MKQATTFFCGLLVTVAFATDWHVDSSDGNDAADGTTPATAWKTLGRVNCAATIQPGDRVLFRRGGEWRGTLTPKSGTPGNPVLYSSYGTGPKPILERSVSRSSLSDWEETAPGLWATKKFEPKILEKVWDGSNCLGWSGSFQEGVKGNVRRVAENGLTFVRVTCTEQPKRQSNLIQIWGPRVDGLPNTIALKMKVRATKPFALERLSLSLNHLPWTAGWNGMARGQTTPEIGPEWSTVVTAMTKVNTIDGAYFHFSIGDVMPVGCTFDFIPEGVWRMEDCGTEILAHDVGIFICNHGEQWGVKKWKLEDLRAPLDYWDDRANMRVFVKCDRNPAETFRSIELAQTACVVNEGGCHDIVYDGLCVRYTGAHGWGGGNTRNIVIRNCDIYWIGGGLQYWRKDPKTGRTLYPVRFGNGIEFWGECHNNLVERNRLWQIYDAALTNQTKDSDRHETDVTWRDNVIWQAEYSFEYWNHDARSFTGNIVFEHNTCVDAGYCWSHGQRPNPNGAHLMLYDNAAPTTNFVVRNNLFVRTTDRSTRMFNDWRAKPGVHDGLEMDHNLYFIPENMVYEYHVNGRERRQGKDIRPTSAKFGAGPEEFAKYQAEMRLDQGSVYGEPQFVDAAKRDYRLKLGSFGANLATDGGPMGARDMPGLDGDQSASR